MGAAYGAVKRYPIKWDVEHDVILEIGSERGEGSTAFFADLARRKGVHFVSVDFNQELIDRVRPTLPSEVQLVCARGEDFLTRMGEEQNIKIAYLDNYDWWWGEDIVPWVDHEDFGELLYSPYGFDLTNDKSQASHLKQTQLVHERNDVGSLILFDDTWQKVDGSFDGKGGTAVPWLLDNGYEILEGTRERGEVVYGNAIVLRRVY